MYDILNDVGFPVQIIFDITLSLSFKPRHSDRSIVVQSPAGACTRFTLEPERFSRSENAGVHFRFVNSFSRFSFHEKPLSASRCFAVREQLGPTGLTFASAPPPEELANSKCRGCMMCASAPPLGELAPKGSERARHPFGTLSPPATERDLVNPSFCIPFFIISGPWAFFHL